MQIIPSIFIQKGGVVSLYKGSDNPEKKTYAASPTSFAKDFGKSANTLFIVDLDGDQSEEWVPKIREVFTGELWWAGQVRSMEKIQRLMDLGINRVVLGQSAKIIYSEAVEKYGSDKILAGLQVRHDDEAPDICEKLAETGFQDILLKDLNAEGTLFHPNFDLMEKCNYFSKINVYASGGVSKERHLALLKKAGVKGVIIGRALYEHQLDLGSMIRRYQGE